MCMKNTKLGYESCYPFLNGNGNFISQTQNPRMTFFLWCPFYHIGTAMVMIFILFDLLERHQTYLLFCSQDNVRNQLIQFELLLTTATFVVAIFGVVAGIFGMNFEIPMFDDPGAFKWVLIITGICGIIIFCSFVWFFKYRRLMPLQMDSEIAVRKRERIYLVLPLSSSSSLLFLYFCRSNQ